MSAAGTGNGGAVECSVWWAAPVHDPSLARVLDDHERKQAGRLRRAEDRARYVTAHALVRFLLADRCGVPAHDLQFDRTCRRCGQPHGKPMLVDAGQVHFNLTHSGSAVAVVITTGAEVGIDIERVDDKRRDDGEEEWLTALAPEILSAPEYGEYLALPLSARPQALAVWWTRKEAVLKATGEGLSTPMRRVTVTPPFVPPEVRRRSDPARVASVQPPIFMRDLRPPGPYVGSVAVVGVPSVRVTEQDAGPLLRRRLGSGNPPRILSA